MGHQSRLHGMRKQARRYIRTMDANAQEQYLKSMGFDSIERYMKALSDVRRPR